MQFVEDFLARDVAVEALVFGRPEFVDFGVQGQHADGGELVALADFPVVEVVGGGDFHHAGAEFAVHIVVGDDRDGAFHHRQAHGLADQVQIALVFRMHRHGGVAEQGFRAGGGYGQKTGAIFQRIVDFPDEAVFLGAHHFQVGDRRA